MTREEKIAKLSTIVLCVVNLEYTYDMGLDFDIITSEGVSNNFGNIGQWPCKKIKISDGFRRLIKDFKSGKNVTDEQMLEIDVCRYLCTYEDMVHGTRLLEEGMLTNALNIIRIQLSNINELEEYLYAYASLEEWDLDICLFSSYDELFGFMTDLWGNAEIKFEDMDDDRLNRYYDIAEENEWNCLPLQTYSLEEDESMTS